MLEGVDEVVAFGDGGELVRGAGEGPEADERRVESLAGLKESEVFRGKEGGKCREVLVVSDVEAQEVSFVRGEGGLGGEHGPIVRLMDGSSMDLIDIWMVFWMVC